MRHCGCGATIRDRDSLCQRCLGIYGADATLWPAWLRYLVREEERDLQRAAEQPGEPVPDEPPEPRDDRYPSERGRGAIEAAWRAIRAMRGDE